MINWYFSCESKMFIKYLLFSATHPGRVDGQQQWRKPKELGYNLSADLRTISNEKAGPDPVVLRILTTHHEGK